MLVDPDDRPQRQTRRVVVRTGGEAVPRLDAGLRRATPVVHVPLGHVGRTEWSAVHASRSSILQLFTTDSTGTPHRAARSQPYGCQSSWPGACASVSIDVRQPASTASRSSRFGGAGRSGREVISTPTPNPPQAAKTSSA